MRNTLTNFLKFAFPLVLGIGLFMYVYKDTDLVEVMDSLSSVDYRWVLLSVLISLIGFYLRGYRWKLLLEPLGYQPKTSNVVIALFIGFFANLLFPRLGEITRCGYLKKLEDIDVSESFGTVISERIIDLASFAILALVTCILEWEIVSQMFFDLMQGDEMSALSDKLLFAGAGLLILGLAGFVLYKFGLFDKLKKILQGLLRGLMSIISLREWRSFFLTTFGIWFIYYIMLYVLFFSMEETADLSAVVALSFLTAGTIGMIVPVQSGIGAYHFFVSAMLVYYGIEGKANTLLPLIAHGSQTILVLVAGLICVVLTFFIRKSSPS